MLLVLVRRLVVFANCAKRAPLLNFYQRLTLYRLCAQDYKQYTVLPGANNLGWVFTELLRACKLEVFTHFVIIFKEVSLLETKFQSTSSYKSLRDKPLYVCTPLFSATFKRSTPRR